MMLSDEMVNFIALHKDEDVNKLVLQGSRFPGIDIQVAASQISARQIAAKKIPLWNDNKNIIFPPHLSMEQCSSQHTALYKASLFSGDSFVDLTSGLGVDFFFLSKHFKHAHYVERQPLLCEIATNNMPLLGAENAEIHNVDAIDFLKHMPHVCLIMIDPARRSSSGSKTVLISDCEPNLTEIEEIMVGKAEKVLVKLSPMLDITIAFKELKYISGVHVVSVNNECKELLLILDKKGDYSNTRIDCVNIIAKDIKSGKSSLEGKSTMAADENRNVIEKFSFIMQDEAYLDVCVANEMGKYLYEPNSSVMKGGGYKTITKQFNVRKLSVNTHLYTSDELVENFPGRKFEVEQISGFSGKDVKTMLKGIEKANLTIRNFPSSVAELRKKLKLKEGGDVYIFATTLWNDKKVLIKCKKC